MKWLFLLVSFLIIYGSVYPFELNLREPSPAELDAFLGTLRWDGTRGDILGNIALFVPYGFLAAFLIGRGWRLAAWFVWFPVWTLFLAFGIQVLQLYMPSREAALNDGLWNLLGTAIGLLPGLVMARIVVARGGDASRAAGALISFPVVMAGCWIGYRLAPYVPSIDLQSWKDSLKPLLLSPTLSGTSTIRSAAGWMAFAALWRGWRGARFNDVLVVPMVLLVMFGEVLVVKNAVTLSNVVGATAGLALWWAVKRSRAGYAVAAGVLALAIGWSGLTPFAFGGAAHTFHLMPFHGFLDGSMYVNVQQLFLKLFLYGSMAWLLVRAGLGYAVSLIAVATGVLGLELAQIYLPRKTPEITDPVLALIAGWGLWLLDRTAGAAAGTGEAAAEDPVAAARARRRAAERRLAEEPAPPTVPEPQSIDAETARTAPAPETLAPTVSEPVDDAGPAPETKRPRARPMPSKTRSFVREKDDKTGRKTFLR
jgi:VanZ family protein